MDLNIINKLEVSELIVLVNASNDFISILISLLETSNNKSNLCARIQPTFKK